MQVAFIVKLDLPDTTNLPGLALELQDDLADAGHVVLSVQPWARPTLETIGSSEPFSLPLTDIATPQTPML